MFRNDNSLLLTRGESFEISCYVAFSIYAIMSWNKVIFPVDVIWMVSTTISRKTYYCYSSLKHVKHVEGISSPVIYWFNKTVKKNKHILFHFYQIQLLNNET